MLFIVMLSIKGGYKMHSIHHDKAKAVCWAECVQHGGEDTSLLELSKDDCTDMLSALEKINAERTR